MDLLLSISKLTTIYLQVEVRSSCLHAFSCISCAILAYFLLSHGLSMRVNINAIKTQTHKKINKAKGLVQTDINRATSLKCTTNKHLFVPTQTLTTVLSAE